MIASDGQIVWVHDQAILVRDEKGRALFWQGVMMDISERKELEERLVLVNDELEMRVLARTSELEDVNEMMSLEIGERLRIESELRETQERYRQLVEDLPGVVYSWSPLWDVPVAEGEPPRPASYISPQMETILGYTAAEWHDMDLGKERLHPHDRERVLALVDRTLQTGESLRAEYRYLAKDGHVVWVLDHATLRSRDALGRPQLFYGVLLDITARKHAEEKAADVEAQYRMLAEEGPIVPYIYELDHDTDPPKVQLQYVSPRTADVMGYPGSSWIEDPMKWYDAMHPDDRGVAREIADSIRRTGEPWAHDYRMIAADGRVIWLHDTGRMVSRDELGRPARFQGVVLDITRRKEEEERLRQAESSLRDLVDHLPVIPWTEVDDPETGRSRITFIGPQVLDVYGYTPEELIAEPNHFERLLHPEDRDRVMRLTRHTMKSGEPWEDRFRMIARDGTIRHVHCLAQLVRRDPGDPGVWHGVTVVMKDPVVGVSPGESGPERVQEGTGAASPATRRSRRTADGSQAAR
jgi:PAS domain S-box-containing protein